MSLFPFSQEGRQTLVYLVLAGCGPALTAVLVWAMWIIRYWPDASAEARLAAFSQLAMCVAAALIIIVLALSCFVSIRAAKIDLSKNGFSADLNSKGDGNA